jgi:hypothetical protein
MRNALSILTMVITGMLLAACSPPTDPLELGREPEVPAIREAAAPTETPFPSAEPTAEPPTDESMEGRITPLPMDMLPPEVEARVSQVRSDLAERLGLPLASVHLQTIGQVIWPDASLGCPQPAVAYAQVKTPGYLIALVADGSEYEYHTDQQNNLVLCLNGQAYGP